MAYIYIAELKFIYLFKAAEGGKILWPYIVEQHCVSARYILDRLQFTIQVLLKRLIRQEESSECLNRTYS